MFSHRYMYISSHLYFRARRCVIEVGTPRGLCAATEAELAAGWSANPLRLCNRLVINAPLSGPTFVKDKDAA